MTALPYWVSVCWSLSFGVAVGGKSGLLDLSLGVSLVVMLVALVVAYGDSHAVKVDPAADGECLGLHALC